MHAAGKGNIYNTGNPGIGKSNTLIFLPGNQGISIPRLGYPCPGKPPWEYYKTLLPYGIGKYHKNKKGGRKCLRYGYGSGYGFGKRVALAQNRAVRAIKKPVIEQEWQEYEPKINGDSITVEILINGVSFKPALININYKCYFIVNKDLITELRLPRVKIPPKSIISFIKENIKKP